MEQQIVLQSVSDRVRTTLLNLADYKDLSTERLKEMAHPKTIVRQLLKP